MEQDVEYVAVLGDSTPQILPLSLYVHEHSIQKPMVA